MNKFTFYISLAVILLALTAIHIWKQKNKCECAKFKYYKEITVHPDLTMESREDSICVAGGSRNGDLMIKKFSE